ncbi:hypothetical protein QJR26_18905 (plasmid) [Clostridium baratii]
MNFENTIKFILFLYRYYLCSFTEDVQKALQDVLELNNEFIQPLSEKEVTRATKSAERCYLDKNKEYKYKNDTLIELLEISEEEEKHMKIIISKREYKRRDRVYQKKKYQEQLKAQGKLSKKQQVEELRLKIKNLRNKGFKNKDVSLMLQIPIKTLERHITYMKKNGLF